MALQAGIKKYLMGHHESCKLPWNKFSFCVHSCMLLLLIGRPLVCHTSASPHVPKNVNLLHYTVNKYMITTIHYVRNMFPMPMNQSITNMDLLVSPSSEAALRDYNTSAWATSDDRWHFRNGVELMVHGLPKLFRKFPGNSAQMSQSWSGKDFNMLRFPPVSTAASRRAKSAEVATWSLQPPPSPRDASPWIVSNTSTKQVTTLAIFNYNI